MKYTMKYKELYAIAHCIVGIALYEIGFFCISWWMLMNGKNILLFLGLSTIILGVSLFLDFFQFNTHEEKNHLQGGLRLSKDTGMRTV